MVKEIRIHRDQTDGERVKTGSIQRIFVQAIFSLLLLLNHGAEGAEKSEEQAVVPSNGEIGFGVAEIISQTFLCSLRGSLCRLSATCLEHEPPVRALWNRTYQRNADCTVDSPHKDQRSLDLEPSFPALSFSLFVAVSFEPPSPMSTMKPRKDAVLTNLNRGYDPTFDPHRDGKSQASSRRGLQR